ncbi:hypothetical protein ACFL2P_02970 [Candidatus Moduliflexota bacterium]
MSYTATMKSVDTEKALALLELEAKPKGAYFNFPCPKCEKQAVIRAYGEKKNVWFCPDCKASGHIISLTMMQRTLKYEDAINFLKEKAIGFSGRKIENELKLTYPLEYHKKLQEEGISEETAFLLEIGKPKGKGILAGHIAFTVFDEEGKKVAYFGIHPETGKAKSHSSFNPELYLYRWNAVDQDQSVFFTPDMFECVRQVMGEHQAVCNFGLPYLSEEHIRFLSKCSMVIFSPKISGEIMIQAAKNLENPLCFLKD